MFQKNPETSLKYIHVPPPWAGRPSGKIKFFPVMLLEPVESEKIFPPDVGYFSVPKNGPGATSVEFWLVFPPENSRFHRLAGENGCQRENLPAWRDFIVGWGLFMDSLCRFFAQFWE